MMRTGQYGMRDQLDIQTVKNGAFLNHLSTHSTVWPFRICSSADI